MKQFTKTPRLGLIALGAIVCVALSAFLPVSVGPDFLEQLGISKSEADSRITGSFLHGYLNSSRASKLKTLSFGDRKTVLNDILVYTKSYVASKEFKEAYQQLRAEQKPQKQTIQSPEEMQANLIAELKNGIAINEENLKKADASMKPIFQEALTSAKQMLAEAQDPNNELLAVYRENYKGMLEMIDQGYENQLAEWEIKFPENQNEYVKVRLQEFIDIASDIDFSATLIDKNGKKVFQNPAYEGKDYRWKLGYRTGKELMDISKQFAGTWLAELDKQ